MPTDTFSVLAATDDQTVSRGSASWPLAGGSVGTRTTGAANLNAGQEYSAGTTTYTTYNALMRWDTSSIPDDATITGATLRFVCLTAANGPNIYTFVGEWYAWDGASGSDYAGSSGGTSAFSAATTGNYTDGTSYDIPFPAWRPTSPKPGSTHLVDLTRLGGSSGNLMK